VIDESAADDGAAHHFWEFILRRRLEREPEFDFEDLAQLAMAIAEFEASR
jgi:hypothetical protein